MVATREKFEVSSVPDLWTEEFVESLRKNRKAGTVARIPVARIGQKLLSLLFDPQDDGDFEVSSEWSIWSANSDKPLEVSESGHRFCIRR